MSNHIPRRWPGVHPVVSRPVLPEINSPPRLTMLHTNSRSSWSSRALRQRLGRVRQDPSFHVARRSSSRSTCDQGLEAEHRRARHCPRRRLSSMPCSRPRSKRWASRKRWTWNGRERYTPTARWRKVGTGRMTHVEAQHLRVQEMAAKVRWVVGIRTDFSETVDRST